MARRSTLLPYIWVCKLYWFPHRGKEGKKKVLLSRKSCLSWLSTKEKCQQEDVRRKDLQSQRKTTPSFLLKESRVHNTLLKRLWTCIELVFGMFSVTVCTWTVQMWLSQLVFEVFSLILKPSSPVFLRPAGSSCGWWAADGPLYWRPSPPAREGRHQKRAGTDTWADRKSRVSLNCDADSVIFFLLLTVYNRYNGWHDKSKKKICGVGHQLLLFIEFR